jgi:putative component of toxin-antitoxin plasmid stabilization module
MARNYDRHGDAGALSVRVKNLIIGADNIGDEYRYGDFINDLRDGGFAGYRVTFSQARDVWSMAQDLVEAEW